jgi:hypothetical protein
MEKVKLIKLENMYNVKDNLLLKTNFKFSGELCLFKITSISQKSVTLKSPAFDAIYNFDRLLINIYLYINFIFSIQLHLDRMIL